MNDLPSHALSTTGMWLTPDGWQAFLCQHGSTVIELAGIEADVHLPRFIPAPVDLHVHGGGGADVMQGDQAINTVLRAHARHGTGAMLATSVTASLDEIDRFLDSARRVMHNPPSEGAQLLGVHLEGPFINPDKRGAQPDFAVPVNADRLESWFASGLVKIMTYAPEMDPGNCVLQLASQYGVKVQLGHTLCDWHRAQTALRAGAGMTHLFNAMSGVAHRNGGAASAALAYADYAEIITDGVHVDQAAFDLARRAIPFLYSVTDATAAATMPDGYYQLGSLLVEKQGNRVLLPDGTLAGSCLTQQVSIRLLRQWGLDWSEIAQLCCEYPARWVGADDYLGGIQIGAMANWLELQGDNPVAVWLQGQRQLLDEPS